MNWPLQWDPRSIQDSLYLIPLLPFFGALVLRLAGRQLGKGNVSIIACSTVFASFVLSAFILVPMAFPQVLAQPTPLFLSDDLGSWFKAGLIDVRASLYVDHLNAVLLAVVTGIGFVIHVYSIEYMRDDPEYHRYFAYLNLFVGFMLVLVLANNIVLMFVGWEGVGLCSYLLIGFWFEDDAKAYAGRKAFVVNRIGDFGFLLGVFVLVATFGSTEINAVPQSGVGSMLAAARSVSVNAPITSGVLGVLGLTYGQAVTAACLLIFVGATGKSAQFPLYVWLPDAMAGPTPVSALIHAATMVTAGVYLIARLSLLFALSPTAMMVVTSIGAFTALFAALMGFAQNDIKKVLAYSTVSQLGFMVIGVGIGAWWQAIFHLVTHAFFKALLFLGSGSVIQGCHHEQDIRKMGGLSQKMPSTAFTFLIGTLAITGVAPLSGYFSKDLLLHYVRTTHLAGYEHLPLVVYYVGAAAALCTAFYMFRLYFLTFSGTPRSEHAEHAQESGTPVRFALWVLAFGSVFGLGWGLPMIAMGDGRQVVFENFMNPVLGYPTLVAHGHHGVYATFLSFFVENASGFVFALAVAWAGMGLAFWLYRRNGIDKFSATLKPGHWLYDAFANKFYVDEIYDFVVVTPFKFVANALYTLVDTLVIEGLAIRGTTATTQGLGKLLRLAQNGDAQRYAAVIAVAVVAIVWALAG
ncbi:MAG: NADH-quinone oxidoreductase subunit L [Myxococcales bacterium]